MIILFCVIINEIFGIFYNYVMFYKYVIFIKLKFLKIILWNEYYIDYIWKIVDIKFFMEEKI